MEPIWDTSLRSNPFARMDFSFALKIFYVKDYALLYIYKYLLNLRRLLADRMVAVVVIVRVTIKIVALVQIHLVS